MENGTLEVNKLNRKVRLRIVANKDCPSCFGSGLMIEQEFRKSGRHLEISLSVCGCVKVSR